VGHVQSGDQEQQGDEVERQGKWGHPPRSAEHGCETCHQHRGGGAQRDDPHDAERVPGRRQKERQRQPDENPVESVQSRVDGVTIETQRVHGERRHDHTDRPGETEPRVVYPPIAAGFASVLDVPSS